MSGGQICKCPESKKPLLERRWKVTQYRCNHSAFNGYHQTSSDYSQIICEQPGCTGCWRTKASYADALYARGQLSSSPCDPSTPCATPV